MGINRFFINDTLEKDSIISIPEDEKKHLKVMRLRENDSIELINGKNVLASGVITQITKKDSTVKITNIKEYKPPKQKIILFQSYIKPAKIDLILEKGCELGVSSFSFFLTSRGEKPFSLKKERHQAILISSIKQCGRLDLPTINYLETFAPPEKTSLFFGDLREKTPFFPEYLFQNPNNKDIGFINGPESGFSKEETAHFENKHGALGVSLGNNVLRTETAAICALSFCQITALCKKNSKNYN